jgi:hypothetical protein
VRTGGTLGLKATVAISTAGIQCSLEAERSAEPVLKVIGAALAQDGVRPFRESSAGTTNSQATYRLVSSSEYPLARAGSKVDHQRGQWLGRGEEALRVKGGDPN